MDWRAPSRLALLFPLLLLAACWTGPLFYTAGDLRTPIPPGDYRQETFGKPADNHPVETEERPIRVSILPDGLTRMEPEGKSDDAASYGFASLDAGRFVGWMRPETDSAGDEVAYFLLEKEGPAFRLTLPVCEDEVKDIALAAGATFAPDAKAPSCKFPDRKSLETGLRELAAIRAGGVRLVPIAPQTVR